MSGLSNDDELRVGIAIARNEFDLVEAVTETELANALRHQAEELEYPEFLLALADALENPRAQYRLKLIRNRRGAPKGPCTFERDHAIARLVRQRANEGVKQEAAIAEVRTRFSVSRATAMKALTVGRDHLAFNEELMELRKEIEARKST